MNARELYVTANPFPEVSAKYEVSDRTNSYLVRSLNYLKEFTMRRLGKYFEKEVSFSGQLSLAEETDNTPFAAFVKHHNPSEYEMIVLLTALVPHLVPGFFDGLIQRFLPQGGEFPEFGGVKGTHHRGTLPTGETAMFLLAGTDPAARMRMLTLFDQGAFLFKHGIVSLEAPGRGDPVLSGRLILEPEFAEVFTTGKVGLPQLSVNFPAEHITTPMEWSDLVLNDKVWEQIKELDSWIRHKDTLMSEWGMGRKLKPGYRVLFHGPPGTGKTLTAMLLGKHTGREVFRIDLSMVVSKFIGETEKNLASLFDKAEHKDWILFFDEADAIFGKRTGVRDAHDKYANQEVSYLLQRIESHPGLVILASNFRNNIDQAFIRRFNSIVYFAAPSAGERLRLWHQSFPPALKLRNDIDLEEFASGYELTGAQIMNIIQYLSLTALDKGASLVSRDDILRGIKREFEKEGK